MKKLIALSLIFSLMASVGAFAAAKPMTVSGTVVSYVAADTAKKTAATLVIKVGTKEQVFVVVSSTKIVGKEKKAVLPAGLKAGMKVDVSYTEDKGVMTAQEITLK
jgi:hypothetical protein